jgi:hypothetical protein
VARVEGGPVGSTNSDVPMTFEAWRAIAVERFGEQPGGWKFV